MPQLRTDIIDVYVFRRVEPAHAPADVEFLQLRRCKGALSATWQTIMGHAHPGESAMQTALRELHEETSFAPPVLLNMWQLEEVNTYFLASHDAIVMSPCFAAEIPAATDPNLNDEHDAFRWVRRDAADRCFVWPGQRQAVNGIIRDVLAADSPLRDILQIKLPPA